MTSYSVRSELFEYIHMYVLKKCHPIRSGNLIKMSIWSPVGQNEQCHAWYWWYLSEPIKDSDTEKVGIRLTIFSLNCWRVFYKNYYADFLLFRYPLQHQKYVKLGHLLVHIPKDNLFCLILFSLPQMFLLKWLTLRHKHLLTPRCPRDSAVSTRLSAVLARFIRVYRSAIQISIEMEVNKYWIYCMYVSLYKKYF